MKACLEFLPFRFLLTLGLVTSAFMFPPPALAQRLLDNDRDNGGALRERVGSIAEEGARFLRESREADAFVGRTPAAEGDFVGGRSAAANGETGAIRSAVDETLRIDVGPAVNQQNVPARQPNVRLNAPRLQIGFSHPTRSSNDVGARLTQRLRSKLPGAANSRVEVSMAGGDAILRGEVATEHDRRMAELLVRFEPGVRGVSNQVQVRPSAPAR